MNFTELLAESDFPAQGIVFIIVIIFSFLKWLFNALIQKKNHEEEPDSLESLYEQYREEIHNRQTTPPPQLEPTPPPLPTTPAPDIPQAEPVTQEQAPIQQKFSAEDIERLRQQKAAYARPSEKQASRPMVRRKNKPLHKMLRNKNSLRQALIAKQILGPPKALSDR